MKKMLVAAVFAWVVLIWWFSNQDLQASTKQTYDFLVKLNMAEERDLILSETEEIRSLKHVARKAAHFGLYYCLGGLVGLTAYGCMGWRKRRWFWYCWGLGTFMAVADELHQYFIPGRAMLLSDVLLDSAGILMALLTVRSMVKAYERLKANKKHQPMQIG